MAALARSDPMAVAATHMSAGRHAEARALYEARLRQRPSDAAALGGLGALALLARQTEQAIELFGAAVAADDRDAGLVLNLGVAYQEAGRAADAEVCYRRAAALAPTLALARSNLAGLLHARGDTAAAIAELHAAVEAEPDAAATRYNLANLLVVEGEADAAEAHYRAALELEPDRAAAWANLGVLLGQLERHDEALACTEEALLRDPDNAALLGNLADQLLRLGRAAEAEGAARRAAALQPRVSALHNTLGSALIELGRLAEAKASFATAARLAPDEPTPPYNLAVVLRREGRLDAALAAAERAATQSPQSALPGLLKADILKRQGAYEAAWAVEADAVRAADPADAGALAPAAFAGRTALVVVDQPGEAILHARYLARLAEVAERVLVACPPRLVRLLSRAVGVSGVAAAEDVENLAALAEAEGAAVIGAARLPGLFATTVDTVPAPGPHLQPPEGLAARWATALVAVPRPRIGLWWEGAGLSLETLSPLLADHPGRIVSLQAGPARRALDRRQDIADAGGSASDFLDLAAAMTALDTVVVADGAVAYLASALGRPTHVLVPCDGHWCWTVGRTVSPWHPTARTYRQTPSGDWTVAVDELRAALRGDGLPTDAHDLGT